MASESITVTPKYAGQLAYAARELLKVVRAGMPVEGAPPPFKRTKEPFHALVDMNAILHARALDELLNPSGYPFLDPRRESIGFRGSWETVMAICRLREAFNEMIDRFGWARVCGWRSNPSESPAVFAATFPQPKPIQQGALDAMEWAVTELERASKSAPANKNQKRRKRAKRTLLPEARQFQRKWPKRNRPLGQGRNQQKRIRAPSILPL